MGLKTCYVKADGIASKMIEWWGGGGWSHVATLDPLDERFVIDARSDVIDGIPAGVQQRPAHYLAAFDCVWVETPATERALQRAHDLLWSQINRPYDRDGILNFITGSLKDRDWRDQSAWFCSEFHVWTEERAGICPVIKFPVYRITPGGAYLIDAALGAKVLP